MRERGSHLYQDRDLAWFEQEWRIGREPAAIAAGMRRRGYDDFTADKARWLAKYHSLSRPPREAGSGRVSEVTVEAVATRRLGRGVSAPADNPKAAVVERHPVPVGGYRILA